MKIGVATVGSTRGLSIGDRRLGIIIGALWFKSLRGSLASSC